MWAPLSKSWLAPWVEEFAPYNPSATPSIITISFAEKPWFFWCTLTSSEPVVNLKGSLASLTVSAGFAFSCTVPFWLVVNSAWFKLNLRSSKGFISNSLEFCDK